MGKYLIAYIVTTVSSFAILFLAGCLIGAVSVPFMPGDDIKSAIQSYAILFNILFVVINFFCFRYSVRRFIEPTNN